MLVNANSPTSMRMKNITTLGRPGTDFLRVSQFQDYPFYSKQFENDKVNELDEEIKDKMRDTNNWSKSPFVQVPNYG